VVLEPTRNIPVVAHKGAHWADIVLKGKSGHGSQPASGISTHVALAHLLPRLLEFQEHCAKEYTHPLLGSSTLNIGQITGGITYNIIPDQTCIRIDRRRIPNEPAREFDGAVRDLLEELVHRNLLLEASMTVVSDTPAFATRPDSPLVIRLTDAIESITGQRPAPEGTSWVSDASPFSRVCDEILVFGPGDIAQAHTEDEFIEEASLHEGTRILGAFLDAYGRPT
jgi:succinyl-diaminopimelate desuccinylase